MDDVTWRAVQAEWENPANWRLRGCYVAPRDPRVWVRKRNPARGWTVNFGHRLSWLWMAWFAGLVAMLFVVRALEG
jgi:uncharacterized membrane protein